MVPRDEAGTAAQAMDAPLTIRIYYQVEETPEFSLILKFSFRY